MNEDLWTETTTQHERQSWSRLIGDHERIAERCREIVALTQRPGVHAAEASRRLLELAVIIADHLGVEDEVADLTAAAMADDQPFDTISAMQADLERLQSEWKRFIARWLPTIHPADWAALGADAAKMLTRLADHVERENRVLYEKALHYGVIKRGATVLH